MTAEAFGIDSENYLFRMLSQSGNGIPNLISRRQYDDRRKSTAGLCEEIRKRIAADIDGGEHCFIVDPKPIEVCKPARSRRCTMGRDNTGDKGYVSAEMQLDLFETASIRPKTPPRSNQKGARPFPFVFRKLRKHIGTDFSQLCDQFLLIRNYAKNVDGLFTRIIGKISAFTVLQYINKINDKPIGQVKYALI